MDVSIIVPVYNGEKWLEDALDSVLCQEFSHNIEVSIFNDGSTDSTDSIVEKYRDRFSNSNIHLVYKINSNAPRGVGYAKNQAVKHSSADYLCFLDADDIMLPERVQLQYDHVLLHPNAIIGCKFSRSPDNSTPRFTDWANGLTHQQLSTQIYTSHGPTLIMPTWFCSRTIFNRVGGFSEEGKGTPEDLIFFYRHLDLDGELFRVNQPLLVYRYHSMGATHSVLESTIWDLRLQRLEEKVLCKLPHFSIWNAGKQGRRFLRSLSLHNQKKVVVFCDVDVKKIKLGFYTQEDSKERPKPRIPIVHFSEVKPPIVICMKQDLTGGSFEKNLKSLNLCESSDYIWFS